MADIWTVRRILAWMAEDFSAKALPDARLDAELIVAHVLGVDRVRLYMDMDRPLQGTELTGIRDLVRRRRAYEPVAYLRGIKEFYGREFVVSPAVLIPRPETELLVERALQARDAEQPLSVLDLCTGSGAIALTLAAERPAWKLTATDISEAALSVARQNAERLGVHDQVTFAQGDLFAAVSAQSFALVTANPPYIGEPDMASLPSDVSAHEPHLALQAGPEGIEIAQRIITEAEPFLTAGGRLLMEMGLGQASALAQVAKAQAWVKDVIVHRDLRGIERLLELSRA